jgi:hypothetical protein
MLCDLNHFEWGLLLYRLAKSDRTPKPKAQMIAFPQSQLQKGDRISSAKLSKVAIASKSSLRCGDRRFYSLVLSFSGKRRGNKMPVKAPINV